MSNRSVNKVILIGNLGSDPDTRYTANGNPVSNLSLATDESYKDRNTGQMVPRTEWHRIVMFGKIAEIATQYLKKGSKVYIEGRLQTRKWQDKNGQDRYSTEIVVDINGQMQMLDSRGTGASPAQSNNNAQSNQPRNKQSQKDKSASNNSGSTTDMGLPEPEDDFNDSIPF